MTGEPAQFIKGKTIQEQMMQILKMLKDQADAIQEQIDDLQRQIDDIGLQSITPIIDGTYAAGRAVADESGNNIESTYAPQTALSDGSVTQVGTANVGTDTKPIKLVGGVPTAVTNDLVDTTSQQDITGEKRIRRTGSMLDFINNNSEYNVVPASSLRSALYYLDKNAHLEGAMEWEKQTDGSHSWAINLRNKNGTWLSRMFKIFKMDDGTEYAVCPTRTYNSANTNDVVTIGSLAANPNVVHTTGNETAYGIKDYPNGINVSHVTLRSGTSTTEKDAQLNVVIDSTHIAQLKLQYNTSNDTVQLLLYKNLNGNWTASTIATL